MGNHRKTLTALARKERWTLGAELGVDRGQLSRELLDAVPALHLIGVENFSLHPEYRHEVESLPERYGARFRLIEMETHEAADLVLDGSIDFVFIDADHSVEAVADDIARWRPKVKPGGWLGGDDYNPANFPGVVQAVDRAFQKKAHILPGRVWGVRC